MTSAVERGAFECALELLNSNSEVCLVAQGGSMRPFICAGDRLRIMRSHTPLQIGEIVWSQRSGIDVIHRVIGLQRDGGFELRGDALPHSDGWFDGDCYLGTVVSVERDGMVRTAPESMGHRCFVAFIRGLRHIEWKFNAVFHRRG